MAVNDRLSDLLVEWEQGRRNGIEPSLEDLCRETPDLLPQVRESINSLRATDWMFHSDANDSAPSDSASEAARAALHDTELPASHLTVQEFAASIFQSGLLSRAEIDELKERLDASALPGEAREIASRLVTEGKLTRYQAAVLLKASKDPLLVDNYVILDTLDTGGMGLVFKALHRSMNRVVALKLLPASMMSARDTVKRFQREVQAAAALKHSNVVAAYDADESSEIAYLVLEYVQGTNLYRLVREQGPCTLSQGADYVRQAATGLAYLHSRGIIHRDVKPANLILANDGTVKLLDMGLVRFASSEDLSCAEMDQELTQAGIVIGTVAYMSPEQALDTRSADQRSDIYSLGCTLFFLLTGRSLYHEETGMKTLLAHREQPVPSIREFCEEAPVSLDAVFRTMVAKRPADRLQSMDEVIAALGACVPLPFEAGKPPAGRQPAAAATRGRPLRHPRSARLAAIALALVATACLAVIIIHIKTGSGSTEIRIDDPKAVVTLQTQPGENPAAAGSQGKPSTAVSPSSTAEPLSNVDLGDFYIPVPALFRPNDPAMIHFELVATTPPESRSELAAQAKNKRAVIRKAVEEVIRQIFVAASKQGLGPLQDVGLHRLLTSRINKLLPQPYVRDVVFDKVQATSLANNDAKPPVAKPVPVVTATVHRRNFNVYLTGLLGTVAASQTVAVRTRVDGEITKVNFTEGQFVHAGDSLFDIDDRIYKTRVAQAQAQLAQDQASLTEGTKVLDRVKKLVAHNAATIAELGAQTAAVGGLEGAVKNNQAAIEAAKLQLNFCHIAAPISGRIGLRLVDKGNLVRAAGATNLAVITQLQPITVVFPLSQDEIFGLQQKLNSGKELLVEAFNREGTTKLATGKLVAIDNQADATTGTVRAKASFSNEDSRLFPNEFVSVHLLIDTLHDAVIVPTSAVQHGAEETFVYVLKPDQTVEKRKIVGDPSEKQETLVRSGLSAGEVVVVQGTDRLVDGAKVELTNASAPGPPGTAGGTKMMSIQFRNAPWTLVLAQFARESNLDLRMQSIPRGVFNRWDSGRYSQSQTLAILNGELARIGCHLHVEGNVLYCSALQPEPARLVNPATDIKAASANALPPPGSSDRTWAEWLLSHISGCTLRTDVDPESVLSLVNELPPIEFHITRIGFTAETRLYRMPPVDATLVRRLNELPALEAISFNPIPETLVPALSSLTRVKSLSLQSPVELGEGSLKTIEDDSLKTIGMMTSLEALRIESNQITDTGLKNLAGLTKLTELFLSKARHVHGSGLRDLGALKLRVLGLPNSGIDDAGLAEVARFPNLEEINLNETWISHKGLAPLARLANLKRLDLDGCRRINDSALADLAKLKHLRSLSLDRTRVTGELVPELQSSLPDCSITWPSQARQAAQMQLMMQRQQGQMRKGR